MMRIQSLLNVPDSPNVLPPFSTLTRNQTQNNRFPTPEYTSQASSNMSSPTPYAPHPMVVTNTSNNMRQKPAKDAALFSKGQAKEPVNYPPYECQENNGVLNRAERQELVAQHKRFRIYPSGGDEGLIYDYVRHIPYNSEKKTFFGKTGREGFELFQYVFSMPNEPDKDYVVMWDYQNGLVRITPFFKALNYAKTTPNKVLSANPGLRELSHSITGGSIAAQGYWMPYGCARAVCATFCWNIRWALTPIFGPSFIKDCLPPSSPNYNRFHIDPEVVRVSQRECEGWSNETERDATQANRQNTAVPSSAMNVTSAPRPGRVAMMKTPQSLPSPKQLRPRKPRVQTALDSPMTNDSDYGTNHTPHSHTYNRYGDSPSVSPKTKLSPATTWTSINRNNTPQSHNRFQHESKGVSPSASFERDLESSSPAVMGTPTRGYRGGRSCLPPLWAQDQPHPRTENYHFMDPKMLTHSNVLAEQRSMLPPSAFEPYATSDRYLQEGQELPVTPYNPGRPTRPVTQGKGINKRPLFATEDEDADDARARQTSTPSPSSGSSSIATPTTVSSSSSDADYDVDDLEDGRPSKRAKIDIAGLGCFRAREFDAACTLLKMNQDDAQLSSALSATTVTGDAGSTYLSVSGRSSNNAVTDDWSNFGPASGGHDGLSGPPEKQTKAEKEELRRIRDERARQSSMRMRMMLELEREKHSADQPERRTMRRAAAVAMAGMLNASTPSHLTGRKRRTVG